MRLQGAPQASCVSGGTRGIITLAKSHIKSPLLGSDYLRIHGKEINKHLVTLGVIVCVIYLLDSIRWVIEFVRAEKHKQLHKWIPPDLSGVQLFQVIVLLVIISISILLPFFYRPQKCPSCKETILPSQKGPWCLHCGAVLGVETPVQTSVQREQLNSPSDSQARSARLKLSNEIRAINGYFFKYELPVWFALYLIILNKDKFSFFAQLDVVTKAYLALAIFSIQFIFWLIEVSVWDKRAKCPFCSTEFVSYSPPNITGFPHMYFPNFCHACGCKLTDDTTKPDVLAPVAKLFFRFILSFFLIMSLK